MANYQSEYTGPEIDNAVGLATINGQGAPDVEMIGKTGQFYIDTTTNDVYVFLGGVWTKRGNSGTESETFWAIYGETNLADIISAYNEEKTIGVKSGLRYYLGNVNLSSGGFELYAAEDDLSTVRFFCTANWAKSVTSIKRESPDFTGTPTAPTAPAGTNSTQIATTAFVNEHVPDKIKDQSGVGISIWNGTQSEFDAITIKDANTLYFVTE